jgi:hypothetical protein
MRPARFLAVPFTVLAVLIPCHTARAGRFQSFTDRFKDNPDQAKVAAATYLGGDGTEWLVGGGFQPDGTIVLVGNALGPTLTVAGKRATVLGGRDGPTPPPPEREPEMRGNKPKTRKDGSVVYKPFGWATAGGTAFVVRLSGDLKTVKSVTRFPWQAGSACGACVDADGAIYVAGLASDRTPSLAADVKALKAPAIESELPERHVYLAKLAPDASRVVWVRHLAGPSAAPDVSISAKGTILFRGPDLRTFTPDGALRRTTVVPGGLSEKIAVNPADGTYAYGHEHHWRTGREPWRCPVLNIHRPDGALLYHLYDWGGPYVGLNNLRLVSDSAVREIAYDADGNLVIYAWSDGGNSVMYREPMDVRAPAPGMKGLGMSAWGAGVLSCAYILRIDTKDYRVSGGTLWLAFLSERDKPNSIWIDTLGFAADGSVAAGGRAAWGLIQTGNHLNEGGEPGGPYVAVFSRDFASLRFASAMNACGATEVRNNDRWAFITGTPGGKPVLLAVCGAAKEEEGYNQGKPAPTVGAVQPAFGGGHLDGHALLMDLSR